MKATILILTSFILFSCGSRNKNLIKTGEKTETETQSSLTEKTLSKNTVSTVTDIRSFLLNNGLKIKSTGQNYELKYGDLVFTGSADLEFSEKKEETLIHHIYQVHTTYISNINYQTKTFFKTDRTSKNLNVQRSGITFGSLIWIIAVSLLTGALISQLIRLYLKRKK